MEYPADFRFRLTNDVIIDYYLRLKHLGIEEGDINQFITTVKISSFDPWDLPSKSKRKWNDDMVWYFYSRDEYKFNEEVWKTSPSYWKETASNTPIIGMWKRTNGVKIGEKKVLVFHSYNEDPNASDWVMHVYQPTFLPPDQRTYVVCKLEFKNEDEDIPSGSIIEFNINQNGASSTK